MKIVIFSLFVLLTAAIDNPKYDQLYREKTLHTLNQEQYWFQQVRDHYNYNSQDTVLWNQRYWVMDNYFNPKTGAIFLYICG